MPHIAKSRLSSANYIHEMTAELQLIANNNKLHTLAYLLGQCAMEADLIVKDNLDENEDGFISSKTPETNRKQIYLIGPP